jgi:stage III sporulation protein SpoIIIAA
LTNNTPFNLPPEDKYYNQELELLLEILPAPMVATLRQQGLEHLIEIVLDLGRIPEARYLDKTYLELGDIPITEADIAFVVNNIGAFSRDNRSGIARTLHRISAIRNRQDAIIGLTCRVGRVVLGTISPIEDVVRSGKSVLLLGRPGVGKTTKLREIARMMANDVKKRVIIVDTSNEIAGDGDIPHPVVGRARRMQVKDPLDQQAIMIEAVENHTPEVIVIDEIGTEAEAQAARTIAERGVTLIATAHGSQLESLIKNPVLSDLIGGIQSVTLGDEEASRRQTQKTILEREKAPTFDVCIEIQDHDTLAIYHDVAKTIDGWLKGFVVTPEIRKVDSVSGQMRVLSTKVRTLTDRIEPKASIALSETTMEPRTLGGGATISSRHLKTFKVFLYAVTHSFFERILERLQLQHLIVVTEKMHEANAVVALRGHARPGGKVLRLAQDFEVPIFYAKTNTQPQIQRALREALEGSTIGQQLIEKLMDEAGETAPMVAWLQSAEAETPEYEKETEQAINEVMICLEKVKQVGQAVELLPRRSYIRRLQHEFVEKQGFSSLSVGAEPERRLKILPAKPKNR